MNEFIDVTRVNGGKSITINTNNIVYFRPSKLSKSNRTEIMVNGIEKPFIVEECYEEVKSKIYNKDSSLEYDEYNGNESKDNKLNVIKSNYQTTIEDYIKDDNTVFVDYKNLDSDNYFTAYKNLLMKPQSSVFVYNTEDKEIAYIKIGTFKDSSDIIMYMTDKYDNMYNMMHYINYTGHDILSVYLKDLINESNIEEIYPIDKYNIIALDILE